MATESTDNLPNPGIVYGELTYWGTIVGAVICVVGSVWAFVGTSNTLDPAFVFESIWQGLPTDEIWTQGTDVVPQGHWYLHHLNTGDGLTLLGVAIGIVSVIPATLAAAFLLLRRGRPFFGSLAVISAIILIAACLAG